LFALIFCTYYLLLLLISHYTGQGVGSNNKSFFSGSRRSPWWLVAIGMIGSSLSGVSFVSVPGMVRDSGFSYMQMVLGFLLGYVIIAFVLLPIFYRHGLSSIYEFLTKRIGYSAGKTASAFFIISKLSGAAVRFYVVVMILDKLVLAPYGIPVYISSLVLTIMMWFYTRKGGIGTIIHTDVLQTICMLSCIVAIGYLTLRALDMSVMESLNIVREQGLTECFNMTGWDKGDYFWKMFLSGIFIPVVMTGLDQDMMQKNLTCKSLKDAKKDMISYGMCFVPVNLILLFVGAILLVYAGSRGITLPAKGDEILPYLAANHMSKMVMALFTLGLVSAAFSSADSALASLTTTIVIDQLGKTNDVNIRRITHIAVCVVFWLVMCAIHAVNSGSLLNLIYTLASYTYGPLLGLFTFAIATKRRIKHNLLIPIISIIAPLMSYAVQDFSNRVLHYSLGYELLLFNAGIVLMALLFDSEPDLSKTTDRK